MFQFPDEDKKNVIRDARKNIHYIDKDLLADLRFSMMPTKHGDKLVTRILVQNEEAATF